MHSADIEPTSKQHKGQASDPLLLTRSELESLLDTKQPKRMCDRLTERGWVFEPPAARGDVPKVDRAYYLSRMSGQKAPSKRVGPRLDFMVAQ